MLGVLLKCLISTREVRVKVGTREMLFWGPLGLAFELQPLWGGGPLVSYSLVIWLGVYWELLGISSLFTSLLTLECCLCLSRYLCTLHSLFVVAGEFFCLLSMCLILNIPSQISLLFLRRHQGSFHSTQANSIPSPVCGPPHRPPKHCGPISEGSWYLQGTVPARSSLAPR